MASNGEKFLVTGAAGCIGAWTIKILLDQGTEVIASDVSEDLRRLRLISYPDEVSVDFVQLDVSKTDEVKRVVNENGITHVVHLAGLQLPFCAANPPLGALVNVVGTVNIFEAIYQANRSVGLAFASSAAVFGASSSYTSGIVGDSSSLMPNSHYGLYKAANEATARVYSMNHGIGSIGLRPFIIYGAGRDQGMTSDPTKAIVAAVAGVPFKIKFGGNVLLTYAPDCAHAFIEASRAAAGSGDAICLNVPGRRVGIAALVEMIERLVPGSEGLITWDPSPIAAPALLNEPALEAAIGSVMNRPLEQGLSESIAHFRVALEAGLISPPTDQPA